MLNLKVAELLVSIQAKDLDSAHLSNMANFVTEEIEGIDRLFEVSFSDCLEIAGTLLQGRVLLDEGICEIYGHEDCYYIKTIDDPAMKPPGILKISANYDRAIIRTRPYNWLASQYKDKPYLTNKDLLNLVFRLAILFHQGLVLHASAVTHHGECYAFLGNSGTGKSTHTDLWVKYFGAMKLNDDSPAVRMINGKAIVYGTPWSGSVDCYENDSAPLAGLCMLRQARENKIVRLEPLEAFTALLSMCTLTVWDQRLINLTIDNLNQLVQTVPVYRLECRPDLEAAELARSSMK
ncbi:MAG TPA: hypothetical protein VN426_01820 [Syntrophomonadaceae bacterium]|nr:hypothetical protein [Syntrophomonadaceae bacterium]